MSDIWQDLRSFADSKGHVPKHERWRWLKDLSHRIGLEEHPDPYWEFLKTQIVREVCLGAGEGNADFSCHRISLEILPQSVSRGLRWGEISVSHLEHVCEESRWYRYGSSQTPEDLALRGFEGYRDLDKFSRDAVLKGIPWSLNLSVITDTDEGLRVVFYLPIGVGYLHNPEGELERAWLEGLKEERQMLRQSVSGPLHLTILNEVRTHCPDVDYDWLTNIVASYPSYHIELGGDEARSRILSSLRRDRSRMDQYLNSLRRSAQDYREIFSFGVSNIRRGHKAIFGEDPRCKRWGRGVAQSCLCDHALDAFIAQDRRGRSILRDFLAQNP